MLNADVHSSPPKYLLCAGPGSSTVGVLILWPGSLVLWWGSSSWGGPQEADTKPARGFRRDGR